MEYRHGSTVYEGVLLTGAAVTTPAPTVLTFPGMSGRDDFVGLARRVVPWGYQALVADVWGRDLVGAPVEELGRIAMALVDDRDRLADLVAAVVSAAAALPEVDAERLAVMGFCFGGMCALDAARYGLPVTGVAGFHSMLKPPPGRPVRPIAARIVLYHGWDDPWAPPEDVLALTAELTEAGADWQLHAFGDTRHAFMMPGAEDSEHGMRYSERAAERAWTSLRHFLGERRAGDSRLSRSTGRRRSARGGRWVPGGVTHRPGHAPPREPAGTLTVWTAAASSPGSPGCPASASSAAGGCPSARGRPRAGPWRRSGCGSRRSG